MEMMSLSLLTITAVTITRMALQKTMNLLIRRVEPSTKGTSILETIEMIMKS
jgi:hypothetical protein